MEWWAEALLLCIKAEPFSGFRSVFPQEKLKRCIKSKAEAQANAERETEPQAGHGTPVGGKVRAPKKNIRV